MVNIFLDTTSSGHDEGSRGMDNGVRQRDIPQVPGQPTTVVPERGRKSRSP